MFTWPGSGAMDYFINSIKFTWVTESYLYSFQDTIYVSLYWNSSAIVALQLYRRVHLIFICVEEEWHPSNICWTPTEKVQALKTIQLNLHPSHYRWTLLFLVDFNVCPKHKICVVIVLSQPKYLSSNRCIQQSSLIHCHLKG